MRTRLCRFLSSSIGLATLACFLVIVFSETEIWQKVVVLVVVFPVIIVAHKRYYGSVQLWEWDYSKKRKKRDDSA
ncbi:putative membrane protein YjdF [Microbacterium proteolyticum]|nr:putative membrane protein YjdF [Microbacterium sp. SORGH_AS_0344]MDQ1169206.1 putative membrane protein YjdF [Microbacterium proteolyticum]